MTNSHLGYEYYARPPVSLRERVEQHGQPATQVPSRAAAAVIAEILSTGCSVCDSTGSVIAVGHVEVRQKTDIRGDANKKRK